VKNAPVPDRFRESKRSLDLKYPKKDASSSSSSSSIFSIFWNQSCLILGKLIQRLFTYEKGALKEDVIALYPAVRSSALDMLGVLQDAMQAGSMGDHTNSSSSAYHASTNFLDDGNILTLSGKASSSSSYQTCGIMGGSAGLDDAALFGWTQPPMYDETKHYGSGDNAPPQSSSSSFFTNQYSSSSAIDDADAAAGFGMGQGGVSADTWTKARNGRSSSVANINSNSTLQHDTPKNRFHGIGPSSSSVTGPSSSALSSIISSQEWNALEGSGSSGLAPLQKEFLHALNDRLHLQLQNFFTEDCSELDENGMSIVASYHTLPSAYDLKMFQERLQTELSLADPRIGGGELSMTTMISENIVDVIERFCDLARSALTNIPEEKFLTKKNTATENLLHDMKVVGVMGSLAMSLRKLPEKTFIIPYRPAQSLQHEEASNMCQIALLPALHEIETLVKSQLLNPLCRVINKGIAGIIAKMHFGSYIEESSRTDTKASAPDKSFVETHLVDVYENISNNLLSYLPPEYASVVASNITTFSIYCFVSNASLTRPLGETGRLKLTQDLADFELALEQLMVKAGSLSSLGGKSYAELRAVRNMLFWSGLENKKLSPENIVKMILREVWIKDVRPSTALHYLFSYAPKLLSSPHHFLRMTAEEYVNSIVKFDGSTEDGEAKVWMTTMSCCEAYQQRESVDSVVGEESDKRIPNVLMIIGPELFRRRRQ